MINLALESSQVLQKKINTSDALSFFLVELTSSDNEMYYFFINKLSASGNENK